MTDQVTGASERHENPGAVGSQVERGVVPLVQKLRGAASAGFDEWRVQDPKDGSYCIAYSWPETMSPEREARAWLADHRARFPNSQHAGYEVACVRVVPEKDRLLSDAADEIERLTEELRESDELQERLSDLLRRTAVALRGPEPPLTRWSWHDVPDRAAAAVAAIEVMQRAAALAAGGERHNA
jgi:hypothetical protein